MQPRDPFAKVRPGERIEAIPAVLWNSMIDAAKQAKQQDEQAASLGSGAGQSGGWVWVQNTTGATVDRFAVLSVSDLIFDPSVSDAAEDEFRKFVTLKGTTPSATYGRRVVITQEPIASQELGRAMLTGPSPVQIDMVDGSDDFADIVAGQTYLRSQPYGPYKILAVQSGTGTKWGYVTPCDGAWTLLGKTAAAHNKAATGTVNVFRGTTPGSETNAGSYTVSAYNRCGNVASGKWVVCTWTGRHWELVAAEC